MSAMLKTQPLESFEARAVWLLETEGQMTDAQAVRRLRELGCIPDDDWDAAAFKHYTRRVRDAWTSKDKRGLPQAGRTGVVDMTSARPLYDMREHWQQLAYEINIGERIKNRDGNHLEALMLRDECLLRYGTAPDVPELPAL